LETHSPVGVAGTSSVYELYENKILHLP